MEYLPKGDLQSYISSNPLLSEDECCEIVYQVFKGLQIMHKEGFAHRDVKPAVSRNHPHLIPSVADVQYKERSNPAMSDQ